MILNKKLGLWDTNFCFFTYVKCHNFFFFFIVLLKNAGKEINKIFVNSWNNNMSFSFTE